ncbi:MAG: hypothetical protein AAGG51_02510 [Cyanobacteria bacterium P01_G01_bin.54]
MSFAKDLLLQAKYLLKKEPKRPKQASLRRAASSAYYALFHLLIDSCTRFFVKGQHNENLRKLLSRAFAHGEMKETAKSFKGGTLPEHLKVAHSCTISSALQEIAEIFCDAQEVRHLADYDLARTLTRLQVKDLIDRVENAFRQWESVRKTPEGPVFMVALFAGKRLKR